MKKSHEEKSWRKVMKKNYGRKAMIGKHEDYLIESHDRKS